VGRFLLFDGLAYVLLHSERVSGYCGLFCGLLCGNTFLFRNFGKALAFNPLLLALPLCQVGCGLGLEVGQGFGLRLEEAVYRSPTL
jgi:hypothetical protein